MNATTTKIGVGTKVKANMACGGWTGIVEVVNKRGHYYVRKFKKNGTLGKVGTWCHPTSIIIEQPNEPPVSQWDTCPKCGKPVQPTDYICGECGEELPIPF